MNRTILSAFVVLSALLIAGQTWAVQVNFDELPPTAVGTREEVIDGFSRTVTDRTGAYGELILEAGGVTVTISRMNGARFDLVDNGAITDENEDPVTPTQTGKIDPATGENHFGAVSLDPFYDTSNNPFIFSFSDTIRSFSLLAGDYGRDLDTMLLYGYDTPTPDFFTDTPVAGSPVIDFLPHTSNSQWTEKRFHLVNDDGFRSVIFIGGNNDFDLFLDQIFFSLSTVPPAELDAMAGELNNSEGDPTTVVPEPATLSLLGLMGLAAFRRNRK